MSISTPYKQRRFRNTRTATSIKAKPPGKTVAHALQVAVSGPFYASLDYLIPENMRGEGLLSSIQHLQPGMRVTVPLGSRSVVGIITSVGGKVHCDVTKLRPISGVLEGDALLSPQLLELGTWAASYYHYPLGDVLLSMLPQALRKARPLPEVEKNNCDAPENILAAKPLEANVEQQQAIDFLKLQKEFSVTLLWGITGSGKTEVYLHWMQELLKNKKQILVLVPEISLTPQTVQRFSDRFNVPVFTMHSRLTPKKSALAWLAASEAGPCIVLGTRSALFIPLKNLGAIIIDEEHDSSFKQHSKWRYHARDCAVMRAKIENIPLLLGTATPSLETFYNVQRERYKLLKLSARAGDAFTPEIIIADETKKQQKKYLCPAVIERAEQHLKNNGQVLFFLNRRGYAPVLRCYHCGWFAKCDSCDVGMTLHQNPRKLHCHHCDARAKVPVCCPNCQQSELSFSGIGTEQLEENLQKLFPEQKVLRIDRDSTKRVGELDKLLQQAESAEAKVLLGTQMLAKGHHFPHLTLVVMLEIDSGLFRVDFRSSEQMGQLLMQVAGRSGREKIKGEVMLQTLCADHPTLNILLEQDYKKYAEHVLAERRLLGLPPFVFYILIRGEAKTATTAISGLEKIKKIIQQRGKELTIADGNAEELKNTSRFAPLYRNITCSGPVAAPMPKRGDLYRAQLLLQSPNRATLQHLLSGVAQHIQQQPSLRGLRWSIDVDPQDMY